MARIYRLSSFHGGIKLPGFKSLSTATPIQTLPLSERYRLPLQQHIGDQAEPLVSVGDRVLKGQLLAQASGRVSAPLHAPTSGTIESIEKAAIPHPSGLEDLCIILHSDGKDEWIERQPMAESYRQQSPQQLRQLLKQAGIVGLGGALFPTAAKLASAPSDKPLKTLVINGAECEPYITCDQKLMEERAAELLAGIRILQHILQPEECLVGIEDNKPVAIQALEQANQQEAENIHIVAVPTLYPMGGERQLIKVLTGREVPSGGLPVDADAICLNVGTAYAVYRAVFHAEPLISRVVTVTGQGVKQPGNWEVPLGTPISALIEAAGGYNSQPQRLILGGPMMGFTLKTDDLPITKGVNCILAATTEELPAEQPISPCIRCGACVEVCPAKLLPQQLYWHTRAKNFEKAQDLHLFDCIECGCCNYVCPSHLPLVSFYRYAKSQVWNGERERQKAEQARMRHEARNERMERAKREKEAKMAQKRAALKKSTATDSKAKVDPKQEAIKAALERVKAKKAEMDTKPANTDNLTPTQAKQVAEADARRARQQEQATTHSDTTES